MSEYDNESKTKDNKDLTDKFEPQDTTNHIMLLFNSDNKIRSNLEDSGTTMSVSFQ